MHFVDPKTKKAKSKRIIRPSNDYLGQIAHSIAQVDPDDADFSVLSNQHSEDRGKVVFEKFKDVNSNRRAEQRLSALASEVARCSYDLIIAII